MMWLCFVKKVLSKGSGEVCISFRKVIKLQRNS